MEQIKSILEAVLSGIKNKQQFSVEAIEGIWKRCALKKIAAHTKVRFFKQGKLYIYVENPAWLYQLNIEKEQITKKLQKLSKKKIKDIRLSVGEINGR